MIVYLETKYDFIKDVNGNRIEQKILSLCKQKIGIAVGKSEIESWRNSLGFMHRLLYEETIPNEAGIAIEFNIPQTSKRIDFIITGLNQNHVKTAVIIELKQWENVDITEKDAIVKTFVGGAPRELSHPSYQAWAYAALLEDFNTAVRSEPIDLKPCAYLHNCVAKDAIHNKFYDEHLKNAPSFLKDDAEQLQKFISKHIKHGDKGESMYRIQEGVISPSKSLAESLSSLLKGNKNFVMIDDQKLAYESALSFAKKIRTMPGKKVLIVNGGPGTGKSVVAINLLVELTARGFVTQYVTKNAAPRAVYESKLTGTFTKSRISNLFSGSGSFTETDKNIFDVLIIDEAHRLNEKSGLFQNLGENQIKELINAAKLAVFFIDENQRVTFKDIGTKKEIKNWAKIFMAQVEELNLESQFRCNGSDGYLAWVDNTLQIRETANNTMESIDYEFKVCKSANELRELIFLKNKINNKARMVSGYCWPWASKKQQGAFDIILPEEGFSARWNLASDGNLWILKEESVSEVGCIHTCQGLEVDYIGVIIGPDLIVRNGVVITDASKRASSDKSVQGFKTMLKKNPQQTLKDADSIIKNTYRTLLTRAQKGCFVYCTDKETNEYLNSSL
jgi:DUF2075 family protein/DNA replication protein DnaC